MKTRFLIIIGIMSAIAIIFASIYYSDFQQREYISELREEQQNVQLLKKHQKHCERMLDDPTFNKQLDAPRWENKTHWFEAPLCAFNKIGSGVTLDRIVYPDPQFCADEYDKMYLKAAAIPCGCCNPPPGEPVCEPVPIEDHIRDMITEEFKPCIGTIDSWAYLAENNDSVWYAFGTNYVKLKMEKTNLEKSIPISITFSGYSQCLNDFHIIVKEHIGDRKIVFEEKYDQVCDDSKPNNEFKTYREINLDGVGTPIVLPKGQYLAELYTDTPQIHGSNYVDKVYFSSHFETGPVIELDAINQSDPSVWVVTGKTTDVKSEIIMHLYNPEDVFVSRDVILPDSDGNFSTIITNGGPLFKLSGHYKITLQQGDVTVPQVSRLFSVVQNEN